jgi:hypothetical protein
VVFYLLEETFFQNVFPFIFFNSCSCHLCQKFLLEENKIFAPQNLPRLDIIHLISQTHIPLILLRAAADFRLFLPPCTESLEEKEPDFSGARSLR